MEPDGNFRPIKKCRISGSRNLVSVLNLGYQALTGVFPQSRETVVSKAPLELVWCPDSGLLQLAHSFNPTEMYGENYGYRSGLNQSMVQHLARKIRNLEAKAGVKPADLVLDIGSNDATSLKAYTVPGLTRVGIDPTGAKFKQYYPDDIALVPDFFSSRVLRTITQKPAKIVTSIAMFYDLEDPIDFARRSRECSPTMVCGILSRAICPRCCGLCSLRHDLPRASRVLLIGGCPQILDVVEMKIVDVQMNAVNGGSFAVTAAKRKNPVRGNDVTADWMLEQEERMGINTPRPYRDFEERVYRHRADLTRLLRALNGDGKKVLGYGASTKGNVVLQFCGIGEKEIPAIAEVNPDKFGSFTPGTQHPDHFGDGGARHEA